jgi:uncharacterized protein (TIGR03663 family)
MTSKTRLHQRERRIPFPWLTIELAIWTLIFVVGLGLRLLNLDAAPLTRPEAADALAALRFAQGENGASVADYSPILFSSQWFAFLVFGANEFTARLLPAIAGSVLVLTPRLLRPLLGRRGALATGALLALSPTAVVLSRTASGDILVAVGAMLCVAGFWRILDRVAHSTSTATTVDSVHSLAVALGLALMLTSSPLAFSALLGIGSAVVVVAMIDPEMRRSLKSAWSIWRTTPNLVTYTLVTMFAAFLLFSTAFAWNFAGLAGASDLLPAWLGGFILWPDSLHINYPVQILVLYEPFILLAGGAGMVLAIYRGRPFARFLTAWSVSSLVIALIRPGRGPGDVMLILLPLACLGGMSLQAMVHGLRRQGRLVFEGFYLLLTLPLWVYLLFNLAAYTRRPSEYIHIDLVFVNVSLPTFLGLVVVAAILVVLLVVALASIHGAGPALRALGLSSTIALLLFTVSCAWGISQNRPADPGELLVLEPTANEVRLLKESLSQVALRHQGSAFSMGLAVLVDDPALAWAMRDFRTVGPADEDDSSLLPPAVVTSKALGPPAVGEEYVGQSFPLRRTRAAESLGCQWNVIQLDFDQVPQLDCRRLVDWLLFRRNPQQAKAEEVVLWLRKDLLSW